MLQGQSPPFILLFCFVFFLFFYDINYFNCALENALENIFLKYKEHSGGVTLTKCQNRELQEPVP